MDPEEASSDNGNREILGLMLASGTFLKSSLEHHIQCRSPRRLV